MLIIPAENAVNWKRPPWVTLGLIMACLLVFLFYQGGDDRKFEAALEDYLESDLLALEAPAALLRKLSSAYCSRERSSAYPAGR